MYLCWALVAPHCSALHAACFVLSVVQRCPIDACPVCHTSHVFQAGHAYSLSSNILPQRPPYPKLLAVKVAGLMMLLPGALLSPVRCTKMSFNIFEAPL